MTASVGVIPTKAGIHLPLRWATPPEWDKPPRYDRKKRKPRGDRLRLNTGNKTYGKAQGRRSREKPALFLTQGGNPSSRAMGHATGAGDKPPRYGF